MTEPEAVALLESLRREGILHRGRHGGSWRFSVPLVASALVAGMGPFQRRQLAAKAVTAVWTGEARCVDPDYLTDLVAGAGGLVDPRHALDALLLGSTEAGEQRPAEAGEHERVLRWLDAAIELTENRAQRAMVMLTHSATCHRNGDHERSLRGTQLLLSDFADELTPDMAQEIQVMAVCALKGVDDTQALREIAELRHRWPGDPAQCAVTRAFAYGMLERWGQARDLLAKTEQRWRAGNATSVMFGSLIQALAALWTGRVDQFERSLAARAHWPLRDVRRHRVEQVNSYASALLVTGDAGRAEKLLIDEDIPVESLRLGDRAMIAAMRGQVDLAVDLARRGVMNGGANLAGAAATHQSVIAVLVPQGRLTAAREILTAARETDQRLGHLLDIAQAQIDRALGENERAAAKLRDCLGAATERGLLIGVDTGWAELADLALQAGDRQQARRCLAEIEHLARTMPTSRVLALTRLVRATVHGDQEAAGECLRLVRERGQPLELAMVMERLVRNGAGDPALLSEAYEILGALDALLYRSWLRNLMREHGIVVPGRTQTVAENERLLAVLAADGLTNKQLALALRASEKSVEGRLSRLFAHTGYRSRIELSTAMLNGEFQPLSSTVDSERDGLK
jgi:tetratricopeptide (TPR) repeat protein